MCAAIANGADQGDIIAAAVERGCWIDVGDCERKRQQLKAEALSVIDRDRVVYAIAEGALTFIGVQLLALARLVAAIPIVGGPASLLVGVLRSRVTATVGRVAAARAANDASFRLISGL